MEKRKLAAVLKAVARKTIVLIALILFAGGSAYPIVTAPPRAITGKVTAPDGKPLAGASVHVKGTNRGTFTDAAGAFKLVVNDKDKTLVISYTGFGSVEKAIGDDMVFNVSMELLTTDLNDVIVVGYGTQKKETVIGSVSTLKNKELIVTKNESVVNMMTGKIPGVRIVQRTAEPGGYDNNLNIRGFKGNPLIVVDGVIGGDIGRIDPNEIESLSVLKDAAASIYGIRASGGVIVITTKKGDKTGKFDINYSVNQAYQEFLGMPQGVSAVDYMMLTNEKIKRDFANNFIANVNPQFTYENIKPYLDGIYPSADWVGETFKKKAPQMQHNLNVNGGNDKISYFFNFGYMKQDGVFKSGDLNYNRFNLRSNVTVNITKGLRAQMLVSGMADQKNQPFQDQWTIFKYTWNQVPTDLIYANNNPLYPNVLSDNANPVIITDADKVGYKTFKKKTFTGQLNLQYDIPGIKGLNAKAMYNYAYSADDNNENRREYTLYTFKADDSTYLPSPVQRPSRIRRSYYTGLTALSQLSLNYANTFFSDHSVAATLVYEQSHQTGDNFFAQRDVELPIDYLFGGLANSSMQGGMDQGGLVDIGFRSIIGRLNYSYRGKYLIEGSFRRDGSNKYQPHTDDQWGFFPAVSVGWVITKENFIRNLISDRILTSLKFRASYGETGDEGGAPFNYLSGFTYPVSNYIFGSSGVNGSTIKLGNPGLSWAVNTKKNLAMDFLLFNGKLDGTLEVFRSDRTGIAGSTGTTLPGTVGADLPQVNINSDRVEGLDFILTYRTNFDKVGLNITGNVGTTRAMTRFQVQGKAGNKMSDWRDGQVNRYQNIWWGIDYDGQFATYDQIANHPVNTGGGNNNVVPGDYYYKDWNEDGVIDGKDNHPIATSDIPLVNFGMNIGITYRGFDLSALLQGAAGVYVQYGEQYAEPLMYNRSALTRFLDSWHTANPDDNVFDPNTQWIPGYYPAMGSPPAQGTKAIQNGSYVRIKTLELGYSISANLLKKVGVKRLRIYANSYNLATFTGLKNYDPEHPGLKPGAGFEDALGGYKYPMNRTFNLGANISF